MPFFLAGAAQTQTHLLAVLYGPPVLLTLVLFWRRWLAPQLGIAIVAALAVVAPFALHLWEIRDQIVDAWTRLPAADRVELRPMLARRADALRTDPEVLGWPSWNLTRERARAALQRWEAAGTR